MKKENKEFETVQKTGRTMNFKWMPQVNTKPIYPDPWRPGKLSCFDLKKKLVDVIGDMTIYHARLLLAKHKTMTKMSEEMLQDYFLALTALSYERAYKGLRCWKPAYGLNLYVQNHVRFAAMSLKTQREKEKLTQPMLVPNEKVSNMSMTFEEAMELAETYMNGGRDDEAAKLYEEICQSCSIEEDEVQAFSEMDEVQA